MKRVSQGNESATEPVNEILRSGGRKRRQDVPSEGTRPEQPDELKNLAAR